MVDIKSRIEYFKTDCPICGSNKCVFFQIGWNKIKLTCSADKKLSFVINCDIFIDEEIENRKRFNSIVLHKLNSQDSVDFEYHYDNLNSGLINDSKMINVFDLMFNYPKTFSERINNILLNLSKESLSFNTSIYIDNLLPALFYCDSDDFEEEKLSLARSLVESGLLARDIDTPLSLELGYRVKLTLQAWVNLDQLKKESLNNGFIAMSFQDKNLALKVSIKKAIESSGYLAIILSDHHHNNYIMPEVFYQIEKCRFMIVDISDSNLGAYYEAGYAQALGKEIIVICDECIFNGKDNKPHFDIAQKNMIIFDRNNLPKLEHAIYQRIEATVGLRTNKASY